MGEDEIRMVPLPPLREVPRVEMDAAGARSAAERLRQSGSDLDALYDDASGSWRGLGPSFHVDGLDEQVHSGLDLLDAPTADWSAAMSRLDGATCTLADAAEELQRRVDELTGRRAGLAAHGGQAPEDEAPRIAAEIDAFNGDCDRVEQDWESAQQTFADELSGISGGEADELPAGGERGADGLDWGGAFGNVTAQGYDDVWMLLSGMSQAETRQWLDRNPQAAAFLATRSRDEFLGASADSPRIRAVQEYLRLHDPHNRPEDVEGMAERWAALTPAEQEQLLYQYPGVFGNMNGVPFNDRGRVNQVTVQGLLTAQEQELTDLRTRREALRQSLGEHPGPGGQGERLRIQGQMNRLDEQIEDKETVLRGLQQADDAYGRPHHPDPDSGLEPGYDTLYVDTAGLGAIVTARGQLTRDTSHIMGFTPGTTTTIASTRGYNEALDRMDGNSPLGTYSIYWAGTALPPGVPSNLDPDYNREGGPRLAAFDRALELQTAEAGTDPRKVWTSHSAGSAMVGSGEKRGMVLDAHVYIAPAGPGQGIDRLYGPMGDDSGDPAESLPTPDTERYLIQNPKDMIAMAQAVQPAQGALGGTTMFGMGGSVTGSSRPDQVFDDVVLLESGVRFDGSGNRESVVGDGDFGGHSDYLQGDTLALRNIQGVLYEDQVYPEIGMDRNFFGERDPLRKHPEDYSLLQDFPRASLDEAYQDATGKERRK